MEVTKVGNSIKDIYIDDYQSVVSDLLTRNKSVLDTTSQFMISVTKVNRLVLKAATSCGCVKIDAHKNAINEELDYQAMLKLMDTHLKGDICSTCREKIENELGNTLFYITSLCNALNISVYDVILKDKEAISTLGPLGLR
jgi:hypothetical protein